MLTPGSTIRIFSPIRLVVFTLFCMVSAVTVYRHELWGDELQGWNLLRSTTTFSELLSLHHNLHPYIWNLIVFVLSRFSDQPEIMQAASWIIICTAAFVLIFYSPFPTILKALILCGYYFLFEYAAFSRGYALAVLFCFLLCAEMKRSGGPRQALYFVWLILLGTSHVLGLFLAFAFHLHYFLIYRQRKTSSYILPLLALIVVGITFLIPEGGNQSTGFTWYTGIHPSISMQVPVRALLPLPVLPKAEFWNTYLFLELLPSKIFQSVLSIGLLLLMLFVFKKSKTSFLFLVTVILLILFFGLVFPMVSARYVGFLYLGFLSALWLQNLSSLEGKRQTIVFVLIIIQIPGGLFAMTQEWFRPFSQYKEVKAMVKETTVSPLITDIWGLNYLASAYDKEFYCLETGRTERRVVLNNAIILRIASPDRYIKGLANYFAMEGSSSLVYLFSNNKGLDSLSSNKYSIGLIEKREGAIERFSNIYLYKIQHLQR